MRTQLTLPSLCTKKHLRDWLSPDGSLIARLYVRSVDGYEIDYLGVARFRVSKSGDDIRVVALHARDLAEVERVKANQIEPLALSLAGELVLHASAAAISDDGAIAFVGPSCSGKSTLAVAMALDGYPFLSDDGIVVNLQSSIASVAPRKAAISLRNETFEYVNALVPHSIDSALDGESLSTKKTSIAASARVPHRDRPTQLRAIYLLDPSVSLNENVCIAPCVGVAAVSVMLGNTFVLDTRDHATLGRHLRQITELLKRVPVFSLRHSRKFEQLPQLVSAIVAHARAL